MASISPLTRPLSQAHRLRRTFSTSLAHRSSASPTVQVVTPPSIKYTRPVGGIRSGFVGFLFGLAASGTYASLHLFDEYQAASNALLLSVEELKASTSKITNQVKRIERVERELQQLDTRAATSDQMSSLKNELKKLVDGLQIEQLKLKAKLSDLETDCGSKLPTGRLC